MPKSYKTQNYESMKKDLNVLPIDLTKKSILSIEEASLFTGMSRSALYKLTHMRKITHSKPNGKLIYIERAVLEEWMLKNRIAADEETVHKAGLFKLATK